VAQGVLTPPPLPSLILRRWEVRSQASHSSPVRLRRGKKARRYYHHVGEQPTQRAKQLYPRRLVRVDKRKGRKGEKAVLMTPPASIISSFLVYLPLKEKARGARASIALPPPAPSPPLGGKNELNLPHQA